MFRQKAEDLREWEYFEETGRFLEASAKLMKLQIEEIFPSPKPDRKKIAIKEIRKVLVEGEHACESGYDLSWLWEYRVKAGRPPEAGDKQERGPAWE